jgi:hypothetical protein
VNALIFFHVLLGVTKLNSHPSNLETNKKLFIQVICLSFGETIVVLCDVNVFFVVSDLH